ncbi:MAG: Com family DNA-binding transcriptional regulator [Candidatus Margulisbacteria bacterium]|nr:Com family DNA-binding transcriptional regulator [Candidatus Margulisiibacteriota bacterium]
MKDFRCKQCNRLLAKVSQNSRVEVKCSRCKTINLFSEEIFITIEERNKDLCTDPETAGN